jgi:hypothetical protein
VGIFFSIPEFAFQLMDLPFCLLQLRSQLRNSTEVHPGGQFVPVQDKNPSATNLMYREASVQLNW